MDELIARLIYGFTNLTRFTGRDDRGVFWTYAGVLLIVMMAGYGVAMTLRMSDLFFSPHSSDIETFHLGGVVAGTAIMSVCLVGLLAAAVARRLHDTGRSGLWGALPLPLLVFGLVQMGRITGAITHGQTPDMDAFLLIFVNNLIYIGALGYLVYLLSGRGTEGVNRFGASQSAPT